MLHLSNNSFMQFNPMFVTQLKFKARNWHLAILCLAIHLLLVQLGQAAVTLPFYEGFAYTNGARLGSAGSGDTIWTIGNSVGNGTPTNSTLASLSYAGLPASSGNGVVLFPAGVNKERGVDTDSFPMTGNNATLYASFLINVQSYGTNNSPIAYFDDNGSASASLQGVAIQSDGKLSLYRNAVNSAPGGTTTTALSLNTTYLIAFRYKSITNSGNDELALWVNPPLGQAGEATPALTINTGGSDRAALRGFFLKQDSSVTANLYFDELRLGTNWTDVTPGGGGVTPGLPRITSIVASGSDVLISGTNGTHNGTYHVLTSADVATPRASWTSIQTNGFDGNGGFSFTNTITNTTNTITGPSSFYIIQQQP